MNQYNNLFARRLMAVFCLIVILLSCFYMVATYLNSRSTGLLVVSSDDANATLSVSGPGKEAEFIGVGSAKIRLMPGQYLLSASDNGKQSAVSVSILKGQNAKQTIDPTSVAPLPTVEGVNFSGLNNLLDAGLSSAQVDKFQYDIFTYKTSAKNVSIVGGTVIPAPHNPDTDIGFTLTFDVRIDYVLYRAKASYTGLNDLSLRLYDQSGKQVYSAK